MSFNLRSRITRTLFSISLALALAGPAHFASAQQVAKRQPDVIKRFNATIYDSAVYKKSNLRPLNPLKFDPDTMTTRVTTLTDYDYVKGEQQLSRDVWVSAAPEVKDKCKGVKGDLAMWLRQLLGLHPNTKITHFVVMVVKKDDIFRPTANPDTTTKWPCSNAQTDNCGESFPDGVSETHIKWMANQMLSSYLVTEPLNADGYPWTRLGYTYNWRAGADRYGASEYVVRQGATVDVESIIPYREYCSSADGSAK